jgi:hypothetical protein
MTLSYLKAQGGKAEKKGRSWNLHWPDGETYSDVVFTVKDAEDTPTVRHLSLEDPKVRGLAERLTRFVPGQPVPRVSIQGIGHDIEGFWSLWRIAIATSEWNRRRFMPLFLADNGKIYTPTARHIWDQLLATTPVIRSIIDVGFSHEAFARLQKAAEEHGQPIYEELLREHQTRIVSEREKAEYAFAARRKAIARIGLTQVRTYRLNLLNQEEQVLRKQLEHSTKVFPEMTPLLLIRVEGGTDE